MDMDGVLERSVGDIPFGDDLMSAKYEECGDIFL